MLSFRWFLRLVGCFIEFLGLVSLFSSRVLTCLGLGWAVSVRDNYMTSTFSLCLFYPDLVTNGEQWYPVNVPDIQNKTLPSDKPKMPPFPSLLRLSFMRFFKLIFWIS